MFQTAKRTLTQLISCCLGLCQLQDFVACLLQQELWEKRSSTLHYTQRPWLLALFWVTVNTRKSLDGEPLKKGIFWILCPTAQKAGEQCVGIESSWENTPGIAVGVRETSDMSCWWCFLRLGGEGRRKICILGHRLWESCWWIFRKKSKAVTAWCWQRLNEVC